MVHSQLRSSAGSSSRRCLHRLGPRRRGSTLGAVVAPGVLPAAVAVDPHPPRRHSHCMPPPPPLFFSHCCVSSSLQRPKLLPLPIVQRRTDRFAVRQFRATRVAAANQDWNSEGTNDDEPSTLPPRKVLVLGSSGALGSSIARHLMSLNPTTASNYRSNATIQVLGADIHPELPRELYTENGWELTDYCSLALAEDEGIDSSNSNSYLQRITARLIQATHSFVGRDQIHEEEKPDGTVPTNSSSSSSNSSSGYLDAIICASGGWQSDPLPISIPLSKNASIASLQQQQQHYQPQKSPGRDDILANAMAQCATIDAMRRQNLDPVVAAAQLAPYFLHPTRPTLFVVLGATAALQPTPGLMGYGLAKSAAHFVVQTLGAASDNSLELKSVRQAGRAHYRNQGPSGLDRCTVLGILPSMLDTPANRQMARQNANTTNDNNSNEHAQKTLDPKTKKAKLDDLFATWTKPQDIAEQIGAWIQAPALRPHSGALLKVYHSSKKTSTSGRGDDNDRGGGGAVFELVR